MRKTSKIILSIGMALAMVVLAGVYANQNVVATLAASTTTTSDKNSITVTGKGAITVSPDLAYVNLAVRTENKDSKVAQSQNATTMEKVMKALKDSSVADKDIKTVGYNMYQNYQYDNNGNPIKDSNYIVENTVQVTIRDISKVGAVIDSAVDAGANVANRIQFTISNPEEVYKKALVAAVQDAKAKGNTIATALNVKIGNPKSVTEQSTYSAPYSYDNISIAREESVTPISAGDLEITANILVEYQY